MSSDTIGCSLADAAASPAYLKFLADASSMNHPSLHVIYINTSLSTKAQSESIVPTITCTSSNVVQTILQASAQVDNLRIIYGPDTYMGRNIKEMLQLLSELSDAEIQALHPQHSQESIRCVSSKERHLTCI